MTSEQAASTFADPLRMIADRKIWEEFIGKRESISCSQTRVEHYKKILADERCVKVIEEISQGRHTFSVPKKKLISKFHAGKKRTVYIFDDYEMMALRLLAHSMHIYDGLFNDNLYSFRSGIGVKEAINKLKSNKICEMFGYKTDIHNYFNSIPVNKLLPELKNALKNDILYSIFEALLSDDRTSFNGEIIKETKGVMAGTPVSPFLANVYLRDIDAFFETQDCIYMRYADDLMILADSKEKLIRMRDLLAQMIADKGLEMNPKKEKYYFPGESFEFLGFSIGADGIDISTASIRKMKGKIRRSARSIRRWMLNKDAPLEGTLKAMIRTYNEKFFGYGDVDDELTWSRWYFPVITTDKSLHEIDCYLQENIRYISTGKHNKKNYRIVSYEMMKKCGYLTLVNEYHSSIGGH